uniref:Uncharacterized protein n=1 Tax=Oryza rufipogon TaxID=4529 RepID=A0A0E0P1R6_ORYRU
MGPTATCSVSLLLLSVSLLFLPPTAGLLRPPPKVAASFALRPIVAAAVSPPPRHRLLRPPPTGRCLLRPPPTVAASFTHCPRSPPCLHHSRSGSPPPSRLHHARSGSYRAKDEDNAGVRTIGERGTTPLPNAIDKPLRPSPLISGRRRASTSPTLPQTVPATMNSGAPDPDTLNSEVADPTIPSLGAPDPAVLASATPDPFVR